jgi:hypothetical protein
MSYKQFVKDLNEFYKDKNNKGTNYEIGQTIIRDAWIKNGRYDELIDFILENWDSGNCDDFIEPFEKKLIEESHIKQYKRLWKKIIYFRLLKLLDTLKDIKFFNLNEIERTDVSDFNVFSVDSYKDTKRVLAFRRKFLISGLHKYRIGLLQLKAENEIEALNQLENAVSNLDVSKIEKKNWC